MAKFTTELNQTLREFIAAQHVFFTGTAPVQGRINVSPKGLDTLRILNDRQLAYLDLTGSGCETAAHIAENGRLTLMFCSFSDKPLILRVYGQGRVVRRRDPDWDDLHRHFSEVPGERQIIVLDIESAQTSCGWGVPVYELRSERQRLADYACEKGPDAIEQYQRKNNQRSIDGLPTYLFPQS